MLTRGRLAIALGVATLTALAVTALSWTRSYAPLEITAYGPGSGFSAKVSAESDSFCSTVDPCSRLLFAVRGGGSRTADVHLVVTNRGRWPITIERAAIPPERCSKYADYCLLPTGLRRSGGPFRPVRVAAHASADLWVRLRGTCTPPQSGAYGTYAVPLMYHYLGVFERSQRLEFPFSVMSTC